MLSEAKLRRKEEMLLENFGFIHGTKKDGAIRLLQAATEHNLCVYPSVDSDPLFDKIRDSTEFKAVRQASTARRDSLRTLKLRFSRLDVNSKRQACESGGKRTAD